MVLPLAADEHQCGEDGFAVRLFIGDDWAQDHHDVEVMDPAGRRLAKAGLLEGVAGTARLHALIGEHVGADETCEVMVGIETDRGPWMQALLAAGYTVIAVNPLQAARYRDRLAVSGARSDAADAHMLADMVRTDFHQLRPIAGAAHRSMPSRSWPRRTKTLIWERARHCQQLRYVVREYLPARMRPP
ncbi:IS110 family transposase [Pseudonocardia sp.]|jgi:transposase|uniref:IS110 family transposase n=1 Tax=Pseudonocardia sp. TaxID=60912 RepID=UPI003D0A3947